MPSLRRRRISGCHGLPVAPVTSKWSLLAGDGIEGKNVERLAEVVRRCYRQVTREDPPARAPDEVVSMWRDNNVFNAARIPSLTFGCARRRDEAGRLYLDINDLVLTAT